MPFGLLILAAILMARCDPPHVPCCSTQFTIIICLGQSVPSLLNAMLLPQQEETTEERGRRIASQWTTDPDAAAAAVSANELGCSSVASTISLLLLHMPSGGGTLILDCFLVLRRMRV